eukprot:gene4207-4902_t
MSADATWKNFKTSFARTKHKVLAKVGAAESTVDSKIQAESEKLFTLFKLMKRLQKNVEKYQDVLKEIVILQNEMAHDILSFDEKNPAYLAYQESQRSLEAERMKMEEFLEVHYHNPLRQYLSQFREIRERLAELDLRRLDMDRYFRDYSIKANKGKDATSLAKTEAKHAKTKQAYQDLSDELMNDMPYLFNDRQELYNPTFAAFINKSAEMFRGAAMATSRVVPVVQHVNEYDVISHSWVITPIDVSSMSKNVRSSSVFTQKNYSSPNTGATSPQSRPRASTMGSTSSPFEPTPPPPSHEAPVSFNKYPSPQPPQPYQPPQQAYQPTPPQSQYQQPAPIQLQKTTSPIPVQQHNNHNPATISTSPQPNAQTRVAPTPVQLQKTTSPNLSPAKPNQPMIIKPAAGATYGTAFSGPGRGVSGTQAPKPNFNGSTPAANPNSGRALPKPASKPSAPSIAQGEALYDFTGEDSTELTFKKGDKISLHTTSGDWMDGELNGRKGLVPANYNEYLQVLDSCEQLDLRFSKRSKCRIDNNNLLRQLPIRAY